MSELTAARLREVLDYCPETGVFTWSAATANCTKLGEMAGWITERGYRKIAIDGTTYRANRLAWLYVYGEWPKRTVDHIDGESLNDAIANLREATQSQNNANAKLSRRNTTGFKGVSRSGNRFVAHIRKNRYLHHLGSFETPEEAHRAYMEAAVRLFGEFARAA